MLKKILGLLMVLVAITIPCFPAFAQDIPEGITIPVEALEGPITEIMEDRIVVDTQNGLVMALIDEATVLNGFEAINSLEIGQYIIITYNGIMTRSLPGQVHAIRLTSYKITGTITSVLSENRFLLNTESYGDLIVTIDSELGEFAINDKIEVVYNGIMALSLPGQIGALQASHITEEASQK